LDQTHKTRSNVGFSANSMLNSRSFGRSNRHLHVHYRAFNPWPNGHAPAPASVDRNHVCFTPESRDRSRRRQCPLCAKSGRRRCSGNGRKRPVGDLDAALRSGKLGPIEAKCFADLANRTGVKIMALTNQRQFRSPSCTMNHQSPVTRSSSFGLRIEATPMLSKPLSEGCVFH
jgi:hypothetical protein